MSAAVVDARISWDGLDRGEIFAAPIDLGHWAGERLDVAVPSDATALILREDEVAAVLLDGSHAVHVLRHDEEPGDVSPGELADRMRMDLEDMPRLRPRVRHVASESQLVYVAAGAACFVEFGDDPIVFPDPARGDLPLEIRGVAHVSVADPVRFHSGFLRATEDLRGRDFDRIVASLVQDGLGTSLAEDAAASGTIEPDPATLCTRARDRLRPGLGALGLSLEALEIVRLEIPVSSAPAPSSLATPTEHR